MHYTFQLLAPSSSAPGRVFRNMTSDSRTYEDLLKGAQRLRGRLYLSDGAISAAELDADGCFAMPGDADAWHLLLLDSAQQVIGCARYLVHPGSVGFNSLRISKCPLALDPDWAPFVRQAVGADLETARQHNLRYVEVGGWALAEEWRGTRAALEIAVGSFALGLMWGGAIGSCTATARHSSAAILRRLGGEPFCVGDGVIPPYYDAVFDCDMQLLRFDYRYPAQRYLTLVDNLARQLGQSMVVTPSAVTHGCTAGESFGPKEATRAVSAL